MVDRDEAGPRPGRLRRDGLEVDLPQPAERARAVDEIEEAAADAADRRDVELPGVDALAEGRRQQRRGAVEHRMGVVDPEAEGADRGAVGVERRAGEAVLLGIDHEVGALLRPERHALRAVLPRPPEAEGAERLAEPRGGRRIDGEFDEFHAV